MLRKLYIHENRAITNKTMYTVCFVASEFHATKPQIYYRHGNVDATYTKLSDFLHRDYY